MQGVPYLLGFRLVAGCTYPSHEGPAYSPYHLPSVTIWKPTSTQAIMTHVDSCAFMLIPVVSHHQDGRAHTWAAVSPL